MRTNILRYLIFTAVFLFSGTTLFAQQYFQSLYGTVTEKYTTQSISEASILITGNNYTEVTFSDSSGNFFFLKIPTGDYRLEISRNNFHPLTFPQIEISTGKELFLSVELETKPNLLQEVMINASTKKEANNTSLSKTTFKMEQSERFAASLNDPQRLVLSFAGVRGLGGMQNSIIVRGNSPKGVMWQVEGIEVPSPNHYSGQGTPGMVSILNNMVLQKVDFYTGAFPAPFGNATSAVFDATLRRGNTKRYEFSVQLSNIGLETSAEGPLSKKNSSSFLIAYRYSTVGLMGKIGYPIGDYITGFQDINFKFHFATKHIGYFDWWGFGGISSIQNAKGKRANGDFMNKYITAASGITHQILFNGTTTWKTILAASAYSDSWHATQTDEYLPFNNTTRTQIYKTLYDYRDISLRFSSSVIHQVSSRVLFNGGIQIIKPFISLTDSSFRQVIHQNMNTGDTISIYTEPTLYERVTKSAPRYHTYIQFITSITEKWQLTAGIHSIFWGDGIDWLLEPRLNLKWQLKQNHKIEIATGLHSRFEFPVFYSKELVQQNYIQPNRNIKPSKAFHANAGYTFAFLNDFYFKTEIYFQYLFSVPAQIDTYRVFTTQTQYYTKLSPVSTLNNINYLDFYYNYQNKGEGMNYGIEITLEKSFSKNYYFLVTTSLYNSLFRVKPLAWYNTQFNGNWIVTLTAGKDFRVGKKYRANIFSINTRLLAAGNDRIPNNTYKDQLKPFVSWDLRVAYKRNLKKYAWEISCDVQNVLNRKNQSNNDFNINIGILPVLKFRTDFGFKRSKN